MSDDLRKRLDQVLMMYFGGPSNYDELRYDLISLLADAQIDQVKRCSWGPLDPLTNEPMYAGWCGVDHPVRDGHPKMSEIIECVRERWGIEP